MSEQGSFRERAAQAGGFDLHQRWGWKRNKGILGWMEELSSADELLHLIESEQINPEAVVRHKELTNLEWIPFKDAQNILQQQQQREQQQEQQREQQQREQRQQLVDEYYDLIEKARAKFKEFKAGFPSVATFREKVAQEQQKIIEQDASNIKKFVQIQNYLSEKQDGLERLLHMIETNEFEMEERKHHEGGFNRCKYCGREITGFLPGWVNYKCQGCERWLNLTEYPKGEKAKTTKTTSELKAGLALFDREVAAYKVLFFHAQQMLVAILESDLLTFYEINEAFDKLGVFDSQHERDLIEKLDDLRVANASIASTLAKINYVNEKNFQSFCTKLDNHFGTVSGPGNAMQQVSALYNFKTFNLLDGALG